MDHNNPDWDSYPFSQFSTPYKFSEPAHASARTNKFAILAENDIKDIESGARSLALGVYHPSLVKFSL
ncbi:hypothetical protein AX14_006649 [Amanita brunnescens Koide BX004]|nr:hypothetical protein AX14_006649 [Amanita brunnescens Koide BX004]